MQKIKNKILELCNYLKNVMKKYPVVSFYILSNFLNGTVMRLFTTGHFGLRAVLMEFGFVLLLASFSLLLKKNHRNFYYALTSILMVIVCIVNSIYYSYYDSFVSVSLLATSVFIKDVGDAIVEVVLRLKDFIYLWQPICLYFVIKKTNNNFKPVKKSFVRTIIISVVFLGIGSALPPYSAYWRLYNLWNRVSVVDTFGVYIYQLGDIVQSLKPKFNNVFGYDKALKDTKDYYNENRRVQSVNDYTGMFEGKNVIAIHAESLQTFTMGMSFNGKELTPNLNKLANSGFFFNNFYAQEGVGTSSDTEFTYATGLLPTNSGTVFVNYYDNKFVTIQNILKDKGYYVFSMHGNDGSFWNRDLMYESMGYDKFYSKSSFDIDEEYGLGLSDKSFFRQVVPKIKDIHDTLKKPFYGTLITLTNHIPWNDADKLTDYDISIPVERDGEIYKNNYLESKTIGRYLKSVHYMDEAIGQFIDDMDKSGLLDDTVIVIYGDHDCKIKMAKNEFNYLYNYDVVNDRIYNKNDEEYTEINEYDYILNKKVPFIVWSKDIKKPKKVDTPMGMIDVSMTLGNMLGIYNKYSLGQDVMDIDKDDGIIVFRDGSYITSKIYYSAKNDETYAISNGVINEEYLNKNSEYADKIISVSYDIVTYNLFNKLK